MEGILDIKNLSVEFDTPKGKFKAVNDVSFSLLEGETLCIVGESGCGKSVTSLTIMGLLPKENCDIIDSEIFYKDKNILAMPEKTRRLLRGKEMSMIFQDPLSSLDPLFTVESQMAEGMKLHLKLSKTEIHDRCLKLLKDVGIQQPERVLKSYPHQLSGGMIQRVMIAIGLSGNPRILIADEPTTALDVTVQAQVLNLMRGLRDQYQMSIILITHNMGVVAEMADRVLVMYAGEIVEAAPVMELFENPSHPYTQGLLECIPTLDESRTELPSIPGMVKSISEEIKGCLFSPRCPHCMDICREGHPQLVAVSESHFSRCFLYQEAQSLGKEPCL